MTHARVELTPGPEEWPTDEKRLAGRIIAGQQGEVERLRTYIGLLEAEKAHLRNLLKRVVEGATEYGDIYAFADAKDVAGATTP